MSRPKDDGFYLYFIVRSLVGGGLGTITFGIVVWLLNASRLLYIVAISLANFVVVLFITRMFDSQTNHLVDVILEKLEKWPRAKNFLLSYF